MSGERFVLAGGGTGGHVMPVLALAEALAEAGAELLVVGSEHGLEKRLVPAAGLELVALGSRQYEGRGPLQRLRALVDLALASARAWRALGRFRPRGVISVGGYAALPAVAAAVLRRVPLALVEPNAAPGRANLLSARFARRVFCGFEAGARAFARRVPRERLRVSGVPLRRALVEAASAASRRRPALPLHLFVFGGSQGARQINEAMMAVAAQLPRDGVEIFHQTGEADRERVAEAYRKAGLSAEVAAFEADMAGRYAWADLALCRAGALTVAELALARLPALLVPYPFAAGDHQSANARELEAAGAARLLPSRPLRPEDLGRELLRLLSDPETLAQMGAAAGGLARPEAAREIAAECRSALARAGEA